MGKGIEGSKAGSKGSETGSEEVRGVRQGARGARQDPRTSGQLKGLRLAERPQTVSCSPCSQGHWAGQRPLGQPNALGPAQGSVLIPLAPCVVLLAPFAPCPHIGSGVPGASGASGSL